MACARLLAVLALAASVGAAAQEAATSEASRRADLDRALLRAVDANDLAGARGLLQRGADPDYDTGRERVLLRALFRKSWEVAEALVDAGASLKIPDRPGCEQRRHCDSIQAALFASFNPALLAKLVSRGLDLDAASVTGHTALTTLVVDQPMAVRVLGGAVQAAAAQPPGMGRTVITQADPPQRAKAFDIPAPDNVARIRALLEAGVDPQRKYRQVTPLMLALGTHNRPPAMVDALISAGARIEHDAAVPAPRAQDVPTVVPGDVAVVTIDAGSPVARNAEGTLTAMRVGPLAWAVVIGRSDVALRLVERDRRIEAADSNLAYFAAATGSWDLVLAATRHGAPANTADRAGVTPLMLAADAGRADVVRALIAVGADVHARSARIWPPLLERRFTDEIGAAVTGHGPPRPRLVGGYTAMRAAEERGHGEVLRVLREAGAR